MSDESRPTPIQQTYTVTGMTCGHCAAAITEEVGALEHVTAVHVDHATGQMTVTTDADVPRDQLVEALDEAGDYAIVPSS